MTKKQFDTYEQLTPRRQIAIIWRIEDVREVRPDLTDAQCWEVLQVAERKHDAISGISWDTLACIADDLFGLQFLTTGDDHDE